MPELVLSVCNKKFPVPTAGNSVQEVLCFDGFVQAGRGVLTEIPCIFPQIREFHCGDWFAAASQHSQPSRGFEAWERATLAAVVNRALEPFQQQHRERIKLNGPAHVWLDASKVVMVAMVVHELATNAVKYGALSNTTGQISVTWDRDAQSDLATLVWQESGGPAVALPKARGFGSHLIERAFGSQLGAAQLTFNPPGLMCRLEIAL